MLKRPDREFLYHYDEMGKEELLGACFGLENVIGFKEEQLDNANKQCEYIMSLYYEMEEQLVQANIKINKLIRASEKPQQHTKHAQTDHTGDLYTHDLYIHDIHTRDLNLHHSDPMDSSTVVKTHLNESKNHSNVSNSKHAQTVHAGDLKTNDSTAHPDADIKALPIDVHDNSIRVTPIDDDSATHDDLAHEEIEVKGDSNGFLFLDSDPKHETIPVHDDEDEDEREGDEREGAEAERTEVEAFNVSKDGEEDSMAGYSLDDDFADAEADADQSKSSETKTETQTQTKDLCEDQPRKPFDYFKVEFPKATKVKSPRKDKSKSPNKAKPPVATPRTSANKLRQSEDIKSSKFNAVANALYQSLNIQSSNMDIPKSKSPVKVNESSSNSGVKVTSDSNLDPKVQDKETMSRSLVNVKRSRSSVMSVGTSQSSVWPMNESHELDRSKVDTADTNKKQSPNDSGNVNSSVTRLHKLRKETYDAKDLNSGIAQFNSTDDKGVGPEPEESLSIKDALFRDLDILEQSVHSSPSKTTHLDTRNININNNTDTSTEHTNNNTDHTNSNTDHTHPQFFNHFSRNLHSAMEMHSDREYGSDQRIFDALASRPSTACSSARVRRRREKSSADIQRERQKPMLSTLPGSSNGKPLTANVRLSNTWSGSSALKDNLHAIRAELNDQNKEDTDSSRSRSREPVKPKSKPPIPRPQSASGRSRVKVDDFILTSPTIVRSRSRDSGTGDVGSSWHPSMSNSGRA